MQLSILIIAGALLKDASAEWTYKTYKGDGTEGAGWPSMDKWIDFEEMWTNNKDIPMSDSCQKAFEFPARSNSLEENADLKAAIISVSEQTGVDKRFILAVAMQETNGCVNIHATQSGDGTVRNPGVMQDHDGDHTCNMKHDKNAVRIADVKSKFPNVNWNAENELIPCPKDMITGMVLDGVQGTAKGDGIVGTLVQAIQAGGPVSHDKRQEPQPTVPIPPELSSCNPNALAQFSDAVWKNAVLYIQYAYRGSPLTPQSIQCVPPAASSAPLSTIATVPTRPPGSSVANLPPPPPPAPTSSNAKPAPSATSNVDISKANAVAYFRAARLYNSGTLFDKDKLEKGGQSNACYVSDIANRLLGWNGLPGSTCNKFAP